MNLRPKSLVYALLALLIASTVALSACDGGGGDEAIEEPAVEEPAVEEPPAEEPAD